MARPRSYDFMPASETDIVPIRVPKELKRRLRIKAAKEGTTVTGIVMEMIVKNMEEEDNE